MIEYATERQIPYLKNIWSACFGDPRAYVDYIFERLLRPDRILVDTDEQGAPAAMLCIEPFELATPNGVAAGAYLYAVATLPAQQGKGRSTALLEAAHQRLAAEGYALSALVPAGESLFRFYGQRGYGTLFDIAKAEVPAAQITPAVRQTTLVAAELGELLELRDQVYADRSRFVRWGRDYLRYIGGECRMLGGEVLRVCCGGRNGYAVCYRAEDLVVVKELALPEDCVRDALAALHARYGAARYQLYLPADTPDMANNVLPFAMVRWYDKEKQVLLAPLEGKAGWIAHVLD